MKKSAKTVTTAQEFQAVANRVTVTTIIGNALLAVFKLLAGLFAHSGAMISDAVHSASDVFSTIVVIIGIRLSAKAPDKEHPYGHERMECVAAILLSMVLLATGFGIGADALQTIRSGDPETLPTPELFALIAAVVSILTKEALYRYTRYHAKRIDSGALMADAWHHRTDALASVGALVGIGGAMLGFPLLDPLASLVIFLFIVKAAYDIFADAINKMVDRSCDEETQEALCNCVLQREEVLCIDNLQTRQFGNKLYVDVEILLDGGHSLQKAHEIAELVHDDIERNFPNVKHIMVHVNSKNK